MKSTLFSLGLLFSWLLSAQPVDTSHVDTNLVFPVFHGWIFRGTCGPAYRYCNGSLCNGEVVDSFENGIVKHRAYYEEGQIVGESSNYYSNGQLASRGSFHNNRRIGEWFTYYESGALKSKKLYWKYELVPLRSELYYENGQLESLEIADSAGFFTFGIAYSQAGDTLELFTPFDSQHSVYKSSRFNESGQLMEVQYFEYVENSMRRVGIWREYDTHGNLLSEKEYPSDFHLDW